MDVELYPRVIVVNGDPFTPATATGVTLISLFKNWPLARLACIYTSTTAPAPDVSVCEQNWFLSPRDMLYPATTNPLPATQHNWVSRRGALQHRESRRLHGVRAAACAALGYGEQQFRLLTELCRYRVSSWLSAWIKDFHPDLVYSMLGSNRLMQLVLDVTSVCDVPLVPHIMDDWISTQYRSSPFTPLLRARLSRLLRRVLARASQGFAIGDAMAAEYTRRYRIPFTGFMNSVELEELALKFVPPPQRPVVRFAYIGGLHLERWCALRDIGLAMQSLRTQGLQAELLIYTQPKYIPLYSEQLTLPPVMRIVGSLAPNDVPAAQLDAAVLIHVESFAPAARAYTRYSLSTKIPEYMATGRPIFAYGPAEVESIRYVEQNGCGLVVTEPTRAALNCKLERLIKSPILRSSLGEQGRATAYARHNAAAQRTAFLARLRQIALSSERSALLRHQ